MQNLANVIRYKLVEMSHFGKAAHLGSALSCIDLIIAAYWSFLNIDPQQPDNPLRDRFILSKGHAIAALYAVLAYKGFFPVESLKSFNQNGSSFPEHPTPYCAPGVEMATGSLGHGLSVGLGHALAAKIQGHPYRVMVLMSDGECNEGSVWEAAMFAAGKKLNNVIALIDFNKWQATGRSEEILKISPLCEKWKAFGWETYEIDGNNYSEILSLFDQISQFSEKPVAIVAHTIKGKGISFMEDDNNWHYRIPSEEDLQKAKIELSN